MARYIPNPFATTIIANSPAMIEAMEAKAKTAVGPAQDIAPVKSGKYRDSIKTGRGVYRGRAVGRLIASDFKSGWIEFGTSKWPAHAVLRRACDAAGLKLSPAGKGA